MLFASYPFEIVGIPCGQFHNQEPGANAEILNGLRYVRPGNLFTPSFPLMSKSMVNGKSQLPLYTWLKGRCGNPSINFISAPYINWDPVLTSDITWNFEKFLIDKNGQPFKRYDPGVPGMKLSDDIKLLTN